MWSHWSINLPNGRAHPFSELINVYFNLPSKVTYLLYQRLFCSIPLSERMHYYHSLLTNQQKNEHNLYSFCLVCYKHPDFILPNMSICLMTLWQCTCMQTTPTALCSDVIIICPFNNLCQLKPTCSLFTNLTNRLIFITNTLNPH